MRTFFDITTEQRTNPQSVLKSVRVSLLQALTILNKAASGKDFVGRDVNVHEDIDELLSGNSLKIAVFYDKTLRTTK